MEEQSKVMTKQMKAHTKSLKKVVDLMEPMGKQLQENDLALKTLLQNQEDNTQQIGYISQSIC